MAATRMLIVDDEDLARENVLFQLSASGINFTWIMEAASGEEALDIIKTNRPDFLITDIKLEDMNGLTLIEKARALQPRLICGVISGYANFEYAQKACRLQAVDYVLKPVKSEALILMLQKMQSARNRLELVEDLSADKYQLTSRLDEKRLQEDMTAFVRGNQLAELSEIKKYVPASACYFQMSIIRADKEQLPPAFRQDLNLLRFSIRNLMTEICANQCIPVNSQDSRNMVLALLWDSSAEQETACLRLTKNLVRLRQAIAQCAPAGVIISSSAIHRTLSSSIFLEAVQALDLRYAYAPEALPPILSFSSYAADLSLPAFVQDRQVFRDSLAELNLPQIQRSLSTLLLRYRQQPALGIREAYTDIVRELITICYKNGLTILPLLGCEHVNGSVLNDCRDLLTLQQGLSKLIDTIFQHWIPERQDIHFILSQVKQTLDRDFNSPDMSTGELAQRFCVSPAYLSAMFKKRYDINISKYIIARRLTYAGRLLTDTDLPVTRISGLCGFNHASYFMRQFKDFYQQTPNEFRAASRSQPGQGTGPAKHSPDSGVTDGQAG
ncbi:response regulator [Oscillospiraceae bacterium HV4-5-C5C]|nr:response regulator [Oscillospiraceae bacterium HV4-5-C5C]